MFCLKALSHECRIGQRMRNELWLAHEEQKLMTLTNEKNNKRKQHKLPNDERPLKGSNGHETHFRRIAMDAKKMAFVPYT